MDTRKKAYFDSNVIKTNFLFFIFFLGGGRPTRPIARGHMISRVLLYIMYAV